MKVVEDFLCAKISSSCAHTQMQKTKQKYLSSFSRYGMVKKLTSRHSRHQNLAILPKVQKPVLTRLNPRWAIKSFILTAINDKGINHNEYYVLWSTSIQSRGHHPPPEVGSLPNRGCSTVIFCGNQRLSSHSRHALGTPASRASAC